MALIMPNGGRTVNWGLPGAQQQMPLTRGPEQLAWQQQNRPEPAAKPAGNFSAWTPGQAQSQQSPYSTATPYGQPKPQNQADNPWNPGGTNQQQTRQPDLTQYMSPGSPFPGTAGVRPPPFQATTQNFDGTTSQMPNFQQRDAFISQINNQLGQMQQQSWQQPGMGAPQFNFPQMWGQAGEMAQQGFQNPFAARDPGNQIRNLLAPQPGQGFGPQATPGGSVNQNTPPRPVLMAPGSPGDDTQPPAYDGTNQSIRPTGNGYVPKRGEYGWDSGGFGDVLFEKPDAPPGQRFDAAAFEAKKRSLLDASAAAARSGNSHQAQKLRSQADQMVENLPILRAKANRDNRMLEAAIKDQQLKRSAANKANAPAAGNPGDRPGDRIVGGFNYSAAQREYDAKRRAEVAANNRIPVAKRNAKYGSDANRRAYEAWM